MSEKQKQKIRRAPLRSSTSPQSTAAQRREFEKRLEKAGFPGAEGVEAYAREEHAMRTDLAKEHLPKKKRAAREEHIAIGKDIEAEIIRTLGRGKEMEEISAHARAEKIPAPPPKARQSPEGRFPWRPRLRPPIDWNLRR